jgi:pyruvate/2-oxoglutarate dehydrogenase complex dihydrolipoamide acyltransferase (E2) component
VDLTEVFGSGPRGRITKEDVQRHIKARLSLESKLIGAHVFGIANTNSVMTHHNDKLLDEVFPGTKRKRPLKPNESLISIEKAQRVLGYKPKYDWKG